MSGLSLQVHTSPIHTIRHGRSTFSPTTATVILGQREAVLVDTLYLREDVDALADSIAESGRQLTTIFITHGHPDHYFGLPRLLERFPAARAVAAVEVSEHVQRTVEEDAKTFGRFFEEHAQAPNVLPSALSGDLIDLEGQTLKIIHVGQADIKPNTSLHVPSLDAVIAGDVIYNGVHQMLALSGPEEWAEWITNVDTIAALEPRTIVAGHKRPEASDDEPERMLAETKAYIKDFADAVKTASSVEDIIGQMTTSWPDHNNLTTLVASAHAAFTAESARA